jgi:4-hydroxy-tetrahydrodipicolinate reductase
MKVLIIGYGKMGKTIEAIVLQRGHQIIGKVDTYEELVALNLTADVAIEFSQPEAAIKNLLFCFDKKIPVVCGTTGWLNHKQEVENACLQKEGGLFYTSNFSLGVNLFFKLNEQLAKLMQPYPAYQISIDETHHTQKKDAPSGTAITLAEGVQKNQPLIKEWHLGETSTPHSLVIHSFRKDPVPGTHVVKYVSAIDDIEIKHVAHSREGFANGAVLVAEWMVGKKGIYAMHDFLNF